MRRPLRDDLPLEDTIRSLAAMADFIVERGNLHASAWLDSEEKPLPAGCVRLRVDAFALTSNNVTYAAFGDAMRYWDFFPAAHPAHGRVPVWGFATVEASATADIEAGLRVYGYLPISDSFDIRPTRATPATLIDGSAHRQALAAVYNTYTITRADPAYDPSREAQQMLFRPLFTTGWMIADSLTDASAAPPRSVIISSASSKTALSLAYCLTSRAGIEVIALTSAANAAFARATGLFARTLTYDEASSLAADGPCAFVDFLGRPELTRCVHEALAGRLSRSLVIGATHWDADRTAASSLPPPQTEFFFVPTYAAARARELGAETMNARIADATRAFYTASAAFLTPIHRKGREAIMAGWTAALRGTIPPSEGWIFSP